MAQKPGWSPPPHGPGPGGVPGPGGANIDREDPAETDRWKMGMHLGVSSKRGGRIRGDGRIYLEKAEHGCAINSYAIASGPM